MGIGDRRETRERRGERVARGEGDHWQKRSGDQNEGLRGPKVGKGGARVTAQ
jgi:hypothetical protein